MERYRKTMETADLKQRIAQGENTTTEFKENFDQEAIETAAAFANTNGGTILIGVSDKRRNQRNYRWQRDVKRRGQTGFRKQPNHR